MQIFFQLYHVKNNLHFNEMIMISTLNYS